MVPQAINNPYAPGAGKRPPHLAGRENEKSVIEHALVRIKGKPDESGCLERVSPPLVLLGPQWAGKTALLDWAKCKAEKMGVRCAFLNERALCGPAADLAKEVMGEKAFATASRKSAFRDELGLPDLLVALGMRTRPAAILCLESIIERQLENGPLLLFLDEAHTVEPELLMEFCLAVHHHIWPGRPLAAVLAGTMNLEGMVEKHRGALIANPIYYPLGLLSRDEARKALSVPARETGMPMEEDALEALVDWTGCYPYFIQLAGEEAWKVAKARGADGITLVDAKEALGVAEQRRQEFYNRRYQSLDQEGLEQYALQAIDLIEASPDKSIRYKKLVVGIREANKDMDHSQAVAAVQSLKNQGFIFENRILFEAGIPSLFDYVKEQGLS